MANAGIIAMRVFIICIGVLFVIGLIMETIDWMMEWREYLILKGWNI
jgi:hypothetical protein